MSIKMGRFSKEALFILKKGVYYGTRVTYYLDFCFV